MTTNKFRKLLESNDIIVFDGGMGTSLFDSGVFINRCFDELNIIDPKMVKAVHKGFVEAGAMVIETNTFGANRYKLSSFGLAAKTADINIKGAALAKESASNKALVAGAVGPLGVRIEPLGPTLAKDALSAFAEQIEALAKGGVDLISLETFNDIEEIRLAIQAVLDFREREGAEAAHGPRFS